MSRKTSRKSIADTLADVDLSTVAATASAEDEGFRTTDKYFYMDPRRIDREGPYVRDVEDEDEESIQRFIEAVEEAREVRHPIGIRTAGPPMDPRYILVYGARRLQAALEAGLPHVPVRDLGEIEEGEALLLQLEENLSRRDMDPVVTAVALHRAVENGNTQAEVARHTGKAKSYVSEMVRAGAGLARLSREEQARVMADGRFTVRAFQEIAKLQGPEERADAIRNMLEGKGKPGHRKETGAAGPAKRKAYRNGADLRFSWRDRDLIANPTDLLEQAREAFAVEIKAIMHRIEELEDKGKIEGAGQDLEGVRKRLAPWLNP